MGRIDMRRHVHELVDQLPPAQLSAIEGLIERMIAPEEAVTDEDRRRLHEGQTWFAERGDKGIPMEEVLAEFGLKPEDFPLNK